MPLLPNNLAYQPPICRVAQQPRDAELHCVAQDTAVSETHRVATVFSSRDWLAVRCPAPSLLLCNFSLGTAVERPFFQQPIPLSL